MEPSSDSNGWVMRHVDRYQRPLILYARQITGRLDTAREVVQETFLRLCQRPAHTLNGSAGPWLYRVCRNLAIDVIRKERPMQSIDDSTTGIAASISAHHFSFRVVYFSFFIHRAYGPRRVVPRRE